MSVRRAQREIDSREFSEWMAYARVEPFGQIRDDLRAGVIAATVANVNRGKGQAAVGPGEFVLKFDKEIDKESRLAEMQRTLKNFAYAHNATQKRGK